MMPRTSLVLLFASAFALSLAACSDDAQLPPRPTGASSSSSSGTGGQGGAGGAGGQGGSGAQGGQGGAGGMPPTPICGDGNVDPGEECDDGNTNTGDLCSPECKVTTSEIEPNDSVATANAWTAPWGAQLPTATDIDMVSFEVTGAPASVTVETRDLGPFTCNDSLIDTVVEILATDGTTVLASDDDGGDGLCSRAVASALPPGKYFARIRPAMMAKVPFSYRVAIGMIADQCGDGVLTPAEQCDDANLNAGDGCSPDCKLEITEFEPNGDPVQANPFTSPWYAVLSPLTDADLVSVQLTGASSTITARTNDGGLGGCMMNSLDTKLDILGPDGTTVLASNDDALGYCSLAEKSGLAPGTYFVKVTAGGRAADGSLYGLTVDITTP